MLGQSRGDFERDVAIEVKYLQVMHGEHALSVARCKAIRPSNRTSRRKILEAAVRQLERERRPAPRGLLGRLFN